MRLGVLGCVYPRPPHPPPFYPPTHPPIHPGRWYRSCECNQCYVPSIPAGIVGRTSELELTACVLLSYDCLPHAELRPSHTREEFHGIRRDSYLDYPVALSAGRSYPASARPASTAEVQGSGSLAQGWATTEMPYTLQSPRTRVIRLDIGKTF